MMKNLFIGNPGTGKSSLMNCYNKKLLFKSGISQNGNGVTFTLDIQECAGQKWMDTPGLADIKLRKAAAAAIDKALQEGGEFRLTFVMTHESGRIKTDDITTMTMVMQACNSQVPQVGVDQYAILINKTKRKWLDKMDQQALESWRESLKATLEGKGMPTTKFIHFAPEMDELEEENDKIVPLDGPTTEFINKLPVLRIDPAKVDDVNADDFDAIYEQMNELADSLKAAQEERERSLKQAEAERQARMLEEARRAELEREKAQEAAAFEVERKHAEELRRRDAAEFRAQQAREEQRKQRQLNQAKIDADAKVERAEQAHREAMKRQQYQAQADAAAKVERAEKAHREAMQRQANQVRADADAKIKAAQEERRRVEEAAAKNRKITAKLDGKGSGRMQLWGGSANEIGLVNDTGVSVNFSTTFHNTTVRPKGQACHDWAYNAVLFWEVPDVTVSWVAPTSPPQTGSVKVQAGQTLRLSQ